MVLPSQRTWARGLGVAIQVCIGEPGGISFGGAPTILIQWMSGKTSLIQRKFGNKPYTSEECPGTKRATGICLAFDHRFISGNLDVRLLIRRPLTTWTCRPARAAVDADLKGAVDGNRNPRPQPQTFSKLASLIKSGQSWICLNWLSGALVGFWGSGFIG